MENFKDFDSAMEFFKEKDKKSNYIIFIQKGYLALYTKKDFLRIASDHIPEIFNKVIKEKICFIEFLGEKCVGIYIEDPSISRILILDPIELNKFSFVASDLGYNKKLYFEYHFKPDFSPDSFRNEFQIYLDSEFLMKIKEMNINLFYKIIKRVKGTLDEIVRWQKDYKEQEKIVREIISDLPDEDKLYLEIKE